MCTGPLSEIGDLRDPTEDTHSIYGDSDLMSSDGREQVNICVRHPAIGARLLSKLYHDNSDVTMKIFLIFVGDAVRQ